MRDTDWILTHLDVAISVLRAYPNATRRDLERRLLLSTVEMDEINRAPLAHGPDRPPARVMTRKRLAVHEAGHAVLAQRYGLEPSLVTIATATIVSAVTGATRDAAGHTSCGGSLDEITTEIDAERHVKIALGGTLDPPRQRAGFVG